MGGNVWCFMSGRLGMPTVFSYTTFTCTIILSSFSLFALCSAAAVCSGGGCKNGGRCTSPNECSCSSGFTGDRCQTGERPHLLIFTCQVSNIGCYMAAADVAVVFGSGCPRCFSYFKHKIDLYLLSAVLVTTRTDGQTDGRTVTG